MIQQTINIAGIMEDSIVDGPACAQLFAQGCPRRCELPHPESWRSARHRYDSAGPVLACEENPLVRGVTFSGGEPFSQAEPLLNWQSC
ncbi:MAG: 4Fe-4S cluster-binding domain-containing protein [Ruthenibacterium lactatiformans]